MATAGPRRRQSDVRRPRPLPFGPAPGGMGPADPDGVMRSIDFALDAARRHRRPMTLVAITAPVPCTDDELARLAGIVRRTVRDTDGLWRDGEVVEAVAGRPARPSELLERVPDPVLARVVVELGRDVPHARGERLEDVRAKRVARVLLHRRPHSREEVPRRHLRARDADHGEPFGEQVPVGERVERREQLLLRQVAGRAIHDERAGVRLAPEPQPCRQRVRHRG